MGQGMDGEKRGRKMERRDKDRGREMERGMEWREKIKREGDEEEREG